MAEVWRASVDYSPDVSKVVALKMIREDLVKVPQLLSLFIDEARITSRISHANVAHVFDFGEEEGRPFLAMELVDGPDLETILNRAKELGQHLPLAFCAHVVAEVARGLGAAHSLADDAGRPYGIVHRDVSPQNVLLSYAGEVKLTDFGIARARDKLTQTETGTVMGKFRYMSPEQVQGSPLDSRSDIFSAGILFYELLTGLHLFDGRTSAEVVDQIRYQEMPELLALRRDVDPALESVLRWTLERDREARCPDAATLARDLERYIHVAHPQFTRDEVVHLVSALRPRQTPGRVGQIAFAGTELATQGTGDDLLLEDSAVPSEPHETSLPLSHQGSRTPSTPHHTGVTSPPLAGASPIGDPSHTTRPGQRKRTLAGTGSEPAPVAEMAPGRPPRPDGTPRPEASLPQRPQAACHVAPVTAYAPRHEEAICEAPMASPPTRAYDGARELSPRPTLGTTAAGHPDPSPPETSRAPADPEPREATSSLPGKASPVAPVGQPGKASPETTASLPGKASPETTASLPDQATSLADELTAALTEEDPDQTALTRRVPSWARDGSAEPAPDAALEATHTIMRRAGQGSQRDAPRPGNRRVVLFTAMVAIALGGVVLLGLYATGHWRPNRPSADAPGHVTTEPRHPGAQTLDPEPSREPRGGTADAAAPEIPLAALDRRIAVLALTGSLQDETLRDALAEQVAHRLMHAWVTSDGQRRLGPTSPRSLGLPPGDSKQVALDTAADLLAERVLLAEALPEQARALLTPLPVEAPDSPEALSKIPATALHVIIAPKSALAQEIHIRAMGLKKAWKMPHATNDGRRYVFPHLLVARDAVQRLAELEPGNALGQALRRYLEAQPRGEPNRGGGLVARLTGVKRVPVKKAPHVKLDLTLELRNAEGQNPVTLEPALWRLHGIGTEPLLPAYWEPEQAKSLAGGEIFTLTLTFAEPLGAPSPALVLSVARPGGGALWLQVESLLIP